MKITLGHTPDSDDAFMFYGMLTGRADSNFEVSHVIDDIEQLNRRAMTGDLDVTAVSAHACAYIPEYTILRSGGSFGLGYGPIVTAKKDVRVAELKKMRIAVPGKMTSAFLLLQLMIGRFEHVEMLFSDIPRAVRDGEVDAGLVIHETQLSYAAEGNIRVADVGKWWHEQTDGLPVPLGLNVMRTGMGREAILDFDRCLRRSIEFGMAHMEDAMKYAMQYSRDKPRELVERFVKMYVNDSTVEMGRPGEESIRTLFRMADEAGLVRGFEPKIAPYQKP